MEQLENQIEQLRSRFDLSGECLEEIRRLCMSHAINCSMDVILLEQSSAWLVNKIINHLEQEEEKLSKLKNLL